jgi:hypothetical protein
MVARLSEVLEIPVDELLSAAGYGEPTADALAQPARSVRPRLSNLPLHELPPDRFEQFMADLAASLYPDCEVTRYGGQGHKQHGVDIIVRRGRRIVATFQCKREATFGPAAVRDAVAAVTIAASSHTLALSRRAASPGAKTEIGAHPKWALWDGDDISRRIRLNLPLDAAVRLVDAYFPGWREDFLGVRAPAPWLTTDEFFLPFMGAQLFTHQWQLVGRTADLAGISDYIADDRQTIGIVLGRGGIGKTRLLRAVASASEAAATREVRFLSVAGEVRPEDFELLPSAATLVIIDDAHERADLAELIAGIGRARPQAKALLAARPYGWDNLAHSLRRLGVHASDLPTWDLDDLTTQQSEGLAREILGPGANEGVVRRLAYLTTDCPLITVLGAGLLKEGRIDPARLETDKGIRAEILRAFRHVLIVDPASGDPELRRAVVDAVALLQPIRSDDPAFRASLEALAGCPFDRLMPHIRGLESSGVLLRRSHSFRIVPDLLGDVILAAACVDDHSGVSTGYIERARKLATAGALQNMFVNVSRIDWQIGQDHPGAPSLADSLWSTLEDEFRAAGIQGRQALLKLLKKTSFFQPARTLALAWCAFDNPTDDTEEVDSALAVFQSPTYVDDVLHQLPPIVKYCAYTLEHTRSAVDLLWELAQRDARPTNQHPDHALRVLTDLAGFESAKPIEFNEAVVGACERWLANPLSGPHSPFDVLEAVLATEGADQQSEGFTLSFRPYGLNLPVVQNLRSRVVAMAFAEARNPDVGRAVRAIRAIESSLHYPIGMFGRSVASKERDAWTPVFLETIELLGDLAAESALDPVVGVAIHRALNWHARYSSGTTHEPALRTLRRLPTSLEWELALLLYDGWGRLLFDHISDHADAERERQARHESLATRMVAELSDDEMVEMLHRRLNAQRRGFGAMEGSSGQFVWTLIGTKVSLAEEICDAVHDETNSALRELIAVALVQLVQHRPDRAVAVAHDLLDISSIDVVRAVAHAFGWGRGRRAELLIGELDLLRLLARHDDMSVRGSVVRAAQAILTEHRVDAIDLLCRVRFHDAPRVAGEILSSFGPNSGLAWEDLSQGQASSILGQLLVCPSIDEYHVSEFLSELSRGTPDIVLKLLRDRVEYAEAGRADGYRALPHDWHTEPHFRAHTRFAQMLRDIRDWIAANLGSWRRRRIGAEMFRAVAQTFDAPVLAVLEEGLRSGLREQIEAVGAILHQAPGDLVWENVAFVRQALNLSARIGGECARAVGGGLHAAVVSGARSGSPGEPFPQDVEQRDRASAIAERLPRDSIEHVFYLSLVRQAEASMGWSLESDAQLVDGREW